MTFDKLKEEEIRSNIIVPLLINIGFSYKELKLETSFSIQLGRGIYDLKNDQKKFIGGRLDILCKADNRNLFIIELKAEDVKINKEADRKQGLSYARLLDPMPPYVILTNGKTTYIYETTTGKEIDDNFVISKGFKPALNSEINLRYQALKNFVGYSFNNLQIFCNSFNNEYLKKFRSSNNDTIDQELQKKYIPNIFVKRGDIIDLFKDFLLQDDNFIFPVIGESGVGKTNTIINLYEEFQEFPSIFYSGTLLGHSFLEELKFDFNLEFSPNETELTLLKKVSDISDSQSKPFIIFIDALDEWIAHDRINQIEKLTKIIKRYGIKLCVSCKDIVWNSYLVQREIPTLLSQHLYDVPSLSNFNESEFEQACTKYSENFELDINRKEISEDFYNPFSLRVLFEVAKNNNLDINQSQDLRETLDTFILQKLSKTGENAKLQRYINSICKLLLKEDKVQIEETIIRDELNLSINEEFPIELFSSNILYKNIIVENENLFIGFYFSKIRDHIISLHVLKLDNKKTKDRIKIINDALPTFIGENAINYFFRTGTNKEKEDSIYAFIKFDKDNSESKLTKIFAQQDNTFIATISSESIDAILNHITYLIKNVKNDGIISREINTILKRISFHHDIEYYLIDLLKTLNVNEKNQYDISPDICRVLTNFGSPKATKLLEEMLLDKKTSNRIRRFVIDSLEHRVLKNKKLLFKSLLLEEQENNGKGVFFYAKNWYSSIEDNKLRDELLKLFDESSDDNLQYLIVGTLSYSKLKDTGELLFHRFENKKYSEYVTNWLCRAICNQNYQLAVPKLIYLLKKDPTCSLSDHILIGLGEMQSKEAIPALFEIISNLDEEVDTWWLSSSFTKIANRKDYEKLEKTYDNSTNLHTKFFIALTLSQTRLNRFNRIILDAISDQAILIGKRSQILSQWSHCLTSVEYKSYSQIKLINKSKAKGKLNKQEINAMYDLLNQNSELSIQALSILINFEESIQKLASSMKKVLPTLNFEFSTRTFSLINVDNLIELSNELNPWLQKILLQSSWKNKILLFNCIQFAGLFGDNKVLESIRFNRDSIIANHQFGKNYIQYIEHTIRTSKDKIRHYLDDM